MKKIAALLVVIIGVTLSCNAAVPHDVDLSWTDSPDKASNPSLFYNVFRRTIAQTSDCVSSLSGMTKINSSAVSTNSYHDAAVPKGLYCYVVTANLGTQASDPSNGATANVPDPKPSPVTSVVVVVN